MARTASITALFTICVFGLTLRGTCSASWASENQCSRTVHDVTITQTKAGGTEWNVSISNPCLCTVQDLTVTCKGFDPPAQKIDPSILVKLGYVCLVNNGDPIHMNDSIHFTYEMDVSFPFRVSDGRMACS